MDALVARLNSMCDAQPFHTGWYVKDLRTGWSADRHGRTVVPSASTRKVAILMAALKAVQEGTLSLDERLTPDNNLKTTSGCFQWFKPGFTLTFHDVLLMMIIVSDNVSTGQVVEKVGLGNVQALCDSLGMTGTTHRAGTPNYQLPRDHGPGIANDTTPVDQGVLLEAIVEGSRNHEGAARLGVTPELCELALDMMSKQRLRNRIPSWLPDGTRIANKTGSLGANLNDIAVVYDGDEPSFIFTFFTDHVPETMPDGMPGRAVVDHLAGQLARATWDALRA